MSNILGEIRKDEISDKIFKIEHEFGNLEVYSFRPAYFESCHVPHLKYWITLSNRQWHLKNIFTDTCHQLLGPRCMEHSAAFLHAFEHKEDEDNAWLDFFNDYDWYYGGSIDVDREKGITDAYLTTDTQWTMFCLTFSENFNTDFRWPPGMDVPYKGKSATDAGYYYCPYVPRSK